MGVDRRYQNRYGVYGERGGERRKDNKLDGMA